LAILGGSFRLLANAVLPLAVVFILSACGGGAERQTSEATVGVRGEGFTFEVPQGWTVARPRDAVVAKHGSALVSVTRFPLVKPYDPTRFAAVAKELDSVAGRVAKAVGSTVSRSETTNVAGRRVRAYTYGDRRIGFVLEGKREYQLFCAHAESACDLLFTSFALAGPQAS
jgi:hypothetical protein